MLAFASKLDFKYHCLIVEKRFVNSREQMVSRLRNDMEVFFNRLVQTHLDIDRFKIYYDCGQTPVTNLLLSTFKARAELDIEFAQAVKPERYKLFQLADMVATLKLVELKLAHGEKMTESEYKFFGGPRNFKRNYLRFVKSKEI